MNDDIETRLQAALSARAEQVTADSLRPGEPPVERVRARGRLVRWGAPLAAAVAALVIIMLVGFPRTGADVAPPEPAARTLDGVVFRVPAGWVYRPVVEGVGCVQPAGTPQRAGECVPVGIEIRVGDFVGWPRTTLNDDDGWSVGQTCATTEALAPQLAVVSNRLVERDARSVGGRTADYRVWRVRCDADVSFTVRLWWLPELAVAVYTLALESHQDSTVDQFVAGLDVSGVRPR
jgi:hypothetical protein